MKTSVVFPASIVALMCTAAFAELPSFSAECPLGNFVDADAGGAVWVNGAEASVQKFNDNYYEAKSGNVTFSISHDGGGANLIVSYTAPGGANGVCRVTKAADDGQGAMAGASASPVVSGTQRVQFVAGTSGAAMSGTLNPNTSVSYVLGAADGQFMRVTVSSLGGALDYKIFNPDGTELLGLMSSDTPYQGQLWQSGDHVVEVVNAGGQPVSFDIGIGIE